MVENFFCFSSVPIHSDTLRVACLLFYTVDSFLLFLLKLGNLSYFLSFHACPPERGAVSFREGEKLWNEEQLLRFQKEIIEVRRKIAWERFAKSSFPKKIVFLLRYFWLKVVC